MSFKIPQIKPVGPLLWWGKFRFMFGHAVFYVSAVNMALMAPTAYNTTLRDWTLNYLGFELPFWMFLLFIFLIIMVGFLVEYMISVPAIIAVSNEQAYKHESPIEKDFQDVKRDTVINMKMIELISQKLGIEIDIEELRREAEKETKRVKI